jgi:hypothetical protein
MRAAGSDAPNSSSSARPIDDAEAKFRLTRHWSLLDAAVVDVNAQLAKRVLRRTWGLPLL